MIDKFAVINNIRFNTALLESLEWDEDLLQAFLVYFNDAINSNIGPEELLTDILLNYGQQTHDIIADLFKEESLEADRYLDSDEGEH